MVGLVPRPPYVLSTMRNDEPTTNLPEIVPGSRRGRVLFFGELLLLASLTAAVIIPLWLEIRHLQQALANEGLDALPMAAERMKFLALIVAWGYGAIIVVYAARMGFMAWRIGRSGCFPAPGVAVPWNRPVRRGTAARRAAIVTGAVAVAFLILGTVGMWAMYSMTVHVWEGILDLAP